MTLDNCIKRYEIWASDDRISPNIREEHRQIATWLNSYKKMLEQEPMLDKIRAEIHATAEMHEDGDYYLRDEWIDEIFDDYKAESEGKE